MGDNFSAFVINLDFETGRRSYMEQQLSAASIPFEIISAVNGKALAPEYIASVYDEQRALAIQGKPLSLGEIGCALSHLSVYRRILAQDQSVALVLEDDALCHPELSELLRPLLTKLSTEKKPVIYLLTHLLRYKRTPSFKPATGYALHPVIDACCAHGYLINRAGAEVMLETFDRICYPIDAWKRIADAGHIRIFGLNPYVIGHSRFAKESNIEVERLIVDDCYQPKGIDRLAFNLRFYFYEKFIYQIWKLLAGIKKQHKQPWDLH